MKNKSLIIKSFRNLKIGFSDLQFLECSFKKLVFSGIFLILAGQSSVAQSWAYTGSMNVERFNHTITVLNDGKVLVTGGSGSSGNLSSCEIYNPSTGTWSTTGSMSTDRYSHTANLLLNGKVLVTGGSSNGSQLNSCELFDPATGAWSPANSMVDGRALHCATLLSNGKVLVSGGILNGDPIGSCELYDPSTNLWSATGSLADPRYSHTANRLLNGNVLIAGGIDTLDISSSCEIYDTASGTWGVADPMSIERYYHTSTLLSNGKVLITGGDAISLHSMSSCELYDPSTGTWSTTDSMGAGRFYHTANILSTGKVMVTGGYSDLTLFNSCEVYDPATGSWSNTDSLTESRFLHNAVVLTGDKVLVTGGLDYYFVLSSCELFSVNCTAPVVTISKNSLPVFCQGAYVILQANSNENVTYLWNTSATTSAIYVNNSGTYSVTVTNASNCKGADTISVTIDLTKLLSAYTIIVDEEAEIEKGSTVKSGGVGALRKKGEVEVSGNSTITGTGTFAKAKSVKVTSGSTVTNAYSGSPASVTLPIFYENPYCNSRCNNHKNRNDIKVKKGKRVVLTDSIFNRIQIESNASVTFTSSVIYAQEIETSKNDTINFNGCTRIYLCDELKISANNVFNAVNKSVVVYAEDDVEIEEGVRLNANIYTRDKLETKGVKNHQNVLKGLFIAEELESHYTDFYMGTECATCGSKFKRSDDDVITEIGTDGFRDANTDYLNVYPNPTGAATTVYVNASSEGTLKVNILSFTGQNIYSYEKTDFTGLAEVPLDLSAYPSGIYFVRIEYADKVKVFKIQKFN